ncbi:MarR family winged helix-turn-helix transcriptional regulator [Martelella mediterranea]|uniref:MarR family transcriptional regulator n=1 Tax=Martelella mediterranea TaxID=293089 RepID=A0A4R3NK99_9HYPH|nr:MarR family winged helix-turn-helix transcriptional regulator [Martelella mediterranea]TCT35281.1 MarR family transcriptional regulator [Martelella mediterranea]
MDASDSDRKGGASLKRLSATMTRNQLLMRRRVISRVTIAAVAPALEVTHLDVLDLVKRLEADGEVTIGAVAEGMRIDPSRASRIVAELVSQGHLERRICQSDARRSILVVTADGEALVSKIHAVKRRLLETITEDWNAEELEAFTALYERFVSALEDYAHDYAHQHCQGSEG